MNYYLLFLAVPAVGYVYFENKRSKIGATAKEFYAMELLKVGMQTGLIKPS